MDVKRLSGGGVFLDVEKVGRAHLYIYEDDCFS